MDVANKYDVIKKESHKGYITFICPKCHELNVMKHNINYKIYGSEFSIADTLIKINCWGCGNEFYNSLNDGIDPEIAPYIAKLNEKGYKTQFSCQGHDENVELIGVVDAYIFFDMFLDDKLFENLPKSWKHERYEDDDTDVDSVNFGDVIRCNDEVSLRKRMNDLSEWVDSLPWINTDGQDNNDNMIAKNAEIYSWNSGDCKNHKYKPHDNLKPEGYSFIPNEDKK